MSSEIIVVLVLVALAIGGLVYLEMNSRRNNRSEEDQIQSEEND
jgi:Flp pilus assembly protein CpaB